MNALAMFVIYERPKDFPRQYVARRWVIDGGAIKAEQRIYAVGETLAAVRAALPYGLAMIPRALQDDQTIVESWV